MVAKFNVTKEIFSKRLKKLMGDRNETTYSIAEHLNLSAATISRYADGKMAPKITTIEVMARYFNVNPAWLMGYEVDRELDIEIESKDLSKDEQILLCNFNKLNDLGKNEANKRVAELTEISKYTLQHTYTTIAAHDDDLTEDEKIEMDRRIFEVLKKR